MQMDHSLPRKPLAEPKELVRYWWTALFDGDMQTVIDLMAEDIVWQIMFVGHLLPHGGVCRGRTDAIKNSIELFEKLYDIKKSRFDVIGLYGDGDMVVMEFVINATTTRGRDYKDVNYVIVVQVADGKIKHVREYPDALKAKQTHLD